VETVLTGLSGASWPDQIIHETVTLSGMYVIVCIDCVICIILACDVYLSDLQVLNLGLWIYSQIWASQVGQAKPSQQCGKPSEASLAM
jgi:hypothetical protein